MSAAIEVRVWNRRRSNRHSSRGFFYVCERDLFAIDASRRHASDGESFRQTWPPSRCRECATNVRLHNGRMRSCNSSLTL